MLSNYLIKLVVRNRTPNQKKQKKIFFLIYIYIKLKINIKNYNFGLSGDNGLDNKNKVWDSFGP